MHARGSMNEPLTHRYSPSPPPSPPPAKARQRMLCYTTSASLSWGDASRAMVPQESRIYRFGAFRIEPDTRSLMLHEQPVPLTPKAFDLLLYMARNRGRLLTKEELLAAVWPDSIVEEGNLSQNIFLLRKALGESSKESRYILTIPGRGYQFAAPLESEPLQMLVHAAHTQTTAIVEEEYFDGLAENAPGKPQEKLPAAKSRNRRWIWAGAAALAVIAGASAMVYRAAQRPVA